MYYVSRVTVLVRTENRDSKTEKINENKKMQFSSGEEMFQLHEPETETEASTSMYQLPRKVPGPKEGKRTSALH